LEQVKDIGLFQRNLARSEIKSLMKNMIVILIILTKKVFKGTFQKNHFSGLKATVYRGVAYRKTLLY